MLEALLALLACQLLGEVVVSALQLPIPGPVLGLFLLLGVLCYRGGVAESVAGVSNGLLAHLSLLFVPAGVGIVQHVDRVSEHWLALTVTLVASTALTLLVTGWVMTRLMRRFS